MVWGDQGLAIVGGPDEVVIGAPMGHKFVGFDWMLFVMVPFL